MSTFRITKAQDRALDVCASDATHVALGGGSRSGKTFILLRAIIIRAMSESGSRHAVFRFRFNSLKASVIYDTLPKVLALCFPDLPSANKMLNKTDWFLTLPNGSEIWFGGLDDKERVEKVLGVEYATMFFNECSQIPWQSIVLALTRLAQKTKKLRLKAYYDFNPPSKKHWTYVRFVEKRNPETRQPEINEYDYAFLLINPVDNKENLDPSYLAQLDALPEKARNRFLLGRFSDDAEHQLWTEQLLSVTRVLGRRDSMPDFLRVVVAVDPSGASGPEDTRSDEIGILVVALGTDNHGYVLEDLSGRYSPLEWAKIAVSALDRHNGDSIIGESNYGGAMVESTIRTANSKISYKPVQATRGKVVRAQPIAALYEQGLVHHVGYFPELEEQLCSMTSFGYQGIRSPDRADAVIWGLTALFPKMVSPEQASWRPPTVTLASRSASRFDPARRKY